MRSWSKKITTLLFAYVCLISVCQGKDLAKKQFSVGNDRIVVVGAGVNGLGVVVSLIENGVQASHITVIEKGPEAGGKVQSIEYKGLSYELGAHVIVPGLYSQIEALRDKYKMTTRPAGRGTGIDLNTGQAHPAITAEEGPEFINQVKRYVKMYDAEWNQQNGQYHLLDPDGFKNIPSSLKMTWYQFIEKNNFPLINKALLSLLGGTGYREINPTQAAIIVRVLSPLLMESLILNPKPIQIFDGGYQELWKRVSLDLQNQGVKFIFSTAITDIERIGSRAIKVIAETKNGPSITQLSEHVIYTGDLSYLPKIIRNISHEERAIFEEVVHSDYRSYLVEFDHLADLEGKSGSRGIYPNIQGIADKTGNVIDVFDQPALVTKPYENSNVAVVYVNASGVVSDEQIRENIVAAFAKIGTSMKIIEGRSWKYFPRANEDTETYFRKLMGLQGRGGLWLSGEIFSYVATHSSYENGQSFAKLFVNNKL